MPTKPFYQSATFWFNIAAAIYETLDAFGAFSALTPQQLAIVLTIGNLLLRIKTTKPLTLGRLG